MLSAGDRDSLPWPPRAPREMLGPIGRPTCSSSSGPAGSHPASAGSSATGSTSRPPSTRPSDGTPGRRSRSRDGAAASALSLGSSMRRPGQPRLSGRGFKTAQQVQQRRLPAAAPPHHRPASRPAPPTGRPRRAGVRALAPAVFFSNRACAKPGPARRRLVASITSPRIIPEPAQASSNAGPPAVRTTPSSRSPATDPSDSANAAAVRRPVRPAGVPLTSTAAPGRQACRQRPHQLQMKLAGAGFGQLVSSSHSPPAASRPSAR